MQAVRKQPKSHTDAVLTKDIFTSLCIAGVKVYFLRGGWIQKGRAKNEGIKAMNGFDFAKEFNAITEQAETESRNNIYILHKEIVQKVMLLEALLKGTNFKIQFEKIGNSIEISVSDYVFDTFVCDLKSVFQIVDLFVIDAVKDGEVHIEMKILNAARIIR